MRASMERIGSFWNKSETVIRYTGGRTSWDGRITVRLVNDSARVLEIPGNAVNLIFTPGGVSMSEATGNFDCFDLCGKTILECITEQRPRIFLGKDFEMDHYQVDPTALVTNEYPFRHLRRLLKSLISWKPADEAYTIAVRQLRDFRVTEEQAHQEFIAQMKTRHLQSIETGGKIWEDLYAELDLSVDELSHPLPLKKERTSSYEYSSLLQKAVVKRLSEIAVFAVKSNNHRYGNEEHCFIPLGQDLKDEEEIVEFEKQGYKVSKVNLTVDLHPSDPPASFPRSFFASPTITMVKKEPVLPDGTRWVTWKEIYWWIKKEKSGEYVAAWGEDKRYRLGAGDLGTVETEKDNQIGNVIELAGLLKSILAELPKE